MSESDRQSVDKSLFPTQFLQADRLWIHEFDLLKDGVEAAEPREQSSLRKTMLCHPGFEIASCQAGTQRAAR